MAPWEFHAISEPNFAGAHAWRHGIDVGDVNADCRNDVLTPLGWFEQPAIVTDTPWPMHAFPASVRTNSRGEPIDEYRVCTSMPLYDVDADGWTDVICARPHDFGIYWWRQTAAPGAEATTFELRVIDEITLPAMHALRLADLDGDTIPEIVTGTRYLAEAMAPPDPPELIYYSMCRDEAAVHFTPHLIDCDSGVGVRFEVADLNGDARLDVVVLNKRGGFYFLQE